MLNNSLVSFDPEALAIDHVSQFAHRAAVGLHACGPTGGGAKGLDVETAIKKYKTHRSILDIEFTFVSS